MAAAVADDALVKGNREVEVDQQHPAIGVHDHCARGLPDPQRLAHAAILVTAAAAPHARPARRHALGALLANTARTAVGLACPAASVGQVTPSGSTIENNGNGTSAGLDDRIYERLLRERIIFLGSEVKDS